MRGLTCERPGAPSRLLILDDGERRQSRMATNGDKAGAPDGQQRRAREWRHWTGREKHKLGRLLKRSVSGVGYSGPPGAPCVTYEEL